MPYELNNVACSQKARTGPLPVWTTAACQSHVVRQYIVLRAVDGILPGQRSKELIIQARDLVCNAHSVCVMMSINEMLDLNGATL